MNSLTPFSAAPSAPTDGAFFCAMKETAMYEVHNHDVQFEAHPMKGDQASRYNALREKAKEFASLIDMCCPVSREKSLGMTKLEECLMWANKSIAVNET